MAITDRMRLHVFRRDDFACVYCGRHGQRVTLHVDHVVPQSAGGPDEIGNLVTACSDCNCGKGAQRLFAGAALTDVFSGDPLHRITPAEIVRRPWLRPLLAVIAVAQARHLPRGIPSGEEDPTWAPAVVSLFQLAVKAMEAKLENDDRGFYADPLRAVYEIAWCVGQSPDLADLMSSLRMEIEAAEMAD